MPLTIVVGTGRCGSTMLSRMLHMHPEVLSLSEFWSMFLHSESSIPTHDMSGEEFWQRMAEPDPGADGLALMGIQLAENVYPFDRGRFDPATGVPAICGVLASLTDDPDALYDKLAPEVSAWPRRPMADHCRALFADLAVMFGRRVVVERSGGTLSQMLVLREQFPEARFVFLHRDGPDCALSMSRNHAFRLVAMRIAASVIDGPSSLGFPLPAKIMEADSGDLKDLISPPFDRERFLAYPLPLTFFAWMWSRMTLSGTNEIRKVRRDGWMTLRYERLLNSTRTELTRLAGFIGVPAERQWLSKACEFVDPRHVGVAIKQLHPGALATLRASCTAGIKAFDLLESEHMTLAKPSL